MVGSKIYIPSAKPLPLPLEQRLRTFVEEQQPATIAFVRSGDGELAVIETASPAQAEQVAAALASSGLSTEPLTAVLNSTSQGRDLERLYIRLKQRELENNWANRQW
ncbi:MAG TPA: hypothetical protein VLA67_05760 [Nitrospiraceae bacterium]|jgi:uncharacterized heparinase superfamily protein|nr:hypothetical protein [Nitrospira sp.]HSF66919.1 hypothetical protein [Nitrospiraceae bacterium]